MRRLLQLLAFLSLLSLSAVVDAPLVANPEDPVPAPGFTIPATAEAAGQALRARLQLLHREYTAARARLEAGGLNDPAALQEQVDRLQKENAAELLVGGAPDDAKAWQALLAQYRTREDSENALGAVWNVLRLAKAPADRAGALLAMADIHVARQDVDTALNLAAMAIAANPGPETRKAYAAVLARFRLTVTATELDNERDLPRACLVLSRPLAAQQPIALADLVSVRPATDVSITASGRSVCVSGLQHGKRYEVQLHPGLVTADGRRLDLLVQQAIAVPDRTARVQFSANAYVLARSGRGLLPVRTVNLAKVPLRLFRIPERNAVPVLLSGLAGADLSGWDRNRLRDELGELVWQGALEVRGERNREAVTNIPIGELIDQLEADAAKVDGRAARGTGIYALAAPLDGAEDWNAAATQWLVISNIGIGTLSALDGLHVFTRALDTAKPAGGVTVRLLANNNTVLAEARSDGSGYVRFAPGLMLGKGGNAPAMLTAEAKGDFNYVAFNGAALDLSERGAEGRPLPGPVDGWLYTDRGIYRPGETVRLAALVRDPRARALPNMPMLVRLTRPGDIQVREVNVRTDALGSFDVALPIAATAVTGQWNVRAYVDPEGAPVGSTSFVVEDFVPPRLEVSARTASPGTRAKAGARVPVQVDARYYYGAPGSGLTANGRARIEIDPEPFPAWKRFTFARVDSEFRPLTVELGGTRTDDAGRATLDLALPPQLDRRQPLRANVLASVYDVGGRPVTARVNVPLQLHERYVGIDPQFDGDAIGAGEAAAFRMLAVDAGGKPVTGASLRVEWVREDVDYVWFNSGGEWNYREQVTEYPSGVDDLRTGADGTAAARRTLADGRYRVDLYDRNGNATASYRFHAGWWHAGGDRNVPDALTVTLDDSDVAAGQAVRAFVRAPFAGRAQVLIANEKVFERFEVDLPAAGRQVEIKVKPEWSPGAYVLVTAWRPELGRPSPQPARALGLAWLGVGRDERRLDVTIEVPERTTPRQVLQVPVTVTGAGGRAPSGRVGITLAAVDEGVLSLTRFPSPDPAGWFLGQRLFYPDARDLYGQLIAPAEAALGALRTGGDLNTENLASLDRRSTKVVALYHRVVTLDANGRAKVPLELPDWNGRLRLMAVAWSADRVGSAERALTVRDPVATDLLLPRFLAPGDRAQATIDVRNPDTVPRTVQLALAAKGSVRADFAGSSVTLAPGAARRFTVPLTALAPGAATFRLTARIGEQSLARDFELAVRPGTPVVTERSLRLVAPGASERLDARVLAGFHPARTRASVLLASGPALDAAAMIEELVAYPYGCTEQALSAALPQLYADRADIAAQNNVRSAVNNVLGRQRSDGSFGAWSVLGEGTPWLTAYAYDVLTRARTAGQDVPKASLDLTADHLRRLLDSREDPRAAAYAAYVLAREGAIKPAEVRRHALANADKATTRLELAHVAAALAAIGERPQAMALFDAAVRKTRGTSIFDDYGSDLRDAAALVTLLAEASPDAALAARLATSLEESLARNTHPSTQELAWLAVAAARLQGDAAPLRATVGGSALAAIPAGQPQRVTLQPSAQQLGAGYTVQNTGTQPLRLQLSVRGAPTAAPPAVADGYRVARTLHDPGTGAAVDAATLRQGQLVLVVIQGASTRDANIQKVLVADLLPAGLEIESTQMDGAGELGLVPVIGRASRTDFVSARDDRYVAALTLGARGRFQLAYLARAVTPGVYEAPGVLVEDMVAPRFRARTAAGRLTVTGPDGATQARGPAPARTPAARVTSR